MLKRIQELARIPLHQIQLQIIHCRRRDRFKHPVHLLRLPSRGNSEGKAFSTSIAKVSASAITYLSRSRTRAFTQGVISIGHPIVIAPTIMPLR
jgi:hypothetical protein